MIKHEKNGRKSQGSKPSDLIGRVAIAFHVESCECDLLDSPLASLYILTTCRPEFQAPWGHRSYVTEITVNRLPQHQIESMAEQVAGGKHLPEDVRQHIVEKTDGVPLFVEELTKAVLESRHLQECNGHYEIVDALASWSIPTTFQDSLMARLDRFVTAKAVAQYAAVRGCPRIIIK